jgi:BirA family transcriptional regulator, biotin operon repressor / biotin---[acetyl-CoA-carboxylase] ligase
MGLKSGPYEGVARELAAGPFASIAYVEETASTNADAAALLDETRFGGHTIVAEYQRRGAARKGRTWIAPAGTALLFTTILPHAVAARELWVVPYWVALAVRNALLRLGVATTLQWPNDLLLEECKIAGLLCQSSVSGSSARVACGIGINVRRPPVDPGIDPPPAYCDDVTPIRRADLLLAILREFERTLPTLDQPGRVCHKWHDAAGIPGKRYRIVLDGETQSFDATAEGLVEGGGLRILREDGKRETITLADARVLR